MLLIDLDPQMNTTKMFGKDEDNSNINYEHLFCEKQLRESSVLEFISETDYKNISILSASRAVSYTHLTSAQGDLETRQAIADYLNNTYETNFKADNLYMTMGAAASLSIAFKALTLSLIHI